MGIIAKKGIGIVGIAGRMGGAIEALLKNDPIFSCVGGFDRVQQQQQEAKFSMLALFKRADYICDFSHSDLLDEIFWTAEKCPKPLLIGSTGHDNLGKSICSIAEKIPVVIAPNTSVGAVVQRWVAGYVASQLPDRFCVDIIESHHRRKVDSPSGTAKVLAGHVAQAYAKRGRPMDVQDQQCIPRSENDIVIHAQRRGRIPAASTVIWTSDEEELSIQHSAFGQQSTFARGALSVFKWIHRVCPAPGLYTMEDVLGLTPLLLQVDG